MMFDALGQDLRFGWRTLRANPAFAAVAVLSMALGIGANTAIFSIVDAVMLRWLPVKDPGRLAVLAVNPARPSPSHNYPDYLYLRDHSGSYSGMIAFGGSGPMGFSIRDGGAQGGTQLVAVSMVTGDYFSVLGVEPALGRIFNAEDNKKEGAHPYAVISHAFWQRTFGGETSVIGRGIALNGSPFTVIDVARSGFTGSSVGANPDIFVPIMMIRQVNPAVREWNTRHMWWLTVIGRLKPGVSIAQATAESQMLRKQIENADPERRPAPAWDKDREVRNRAVVLGGSRGFSGMRNQIGKPLTILMVVVGLVLLIACANVANLLLARSASRQREIAIRLALGASRGRLVMQMLVESVTLSLAGGLLGIGFAYAGSRALLTFLPRGNFPIYLDVAPNARLLLFAFLVSLAAAVVSGLVPALRATRPNLTGWLKNEASASDSVLSRAGLGRVDLKKILVVAQVALSIVLLIGAGLLVRSLGNLRSLDTGFRRENVLMVRVDPSQNGYPAQRLRAFYERLLRETQALPAVRSASLANITPLGGSRWNQNVSIQGYQWKPDERPDIDFNAVSPRFFETLGITIVLGRDFTDLDSPAIIRERSFRPNEPETDQPGDPPRVAIINETMARRFFPAQGAIGQRFTMGDKFRMEGSYEIVGVVRDARYFNLREAVQSMIYLPNWRAGAGRRTLCARTTGDPKSLSETMRRLVQAQDSSVPVLQTRSMEDFLDDHVLQERLVASLCGVFGLLALLLASIGLYGVMAHAVTRRVHEIGIRMALGAGRPGVLWMILRDALAMVVIGALAGIPGALALTRFIASMLYGVKPQDLSIAALSFAVLASVTLIASLVPAQRASRVDPMVALRYE